MLIGIDASRATVARRTGTENYSLQVTRELLVAAPEHRFRLYLREPDAANVLPKPPNAEVRLLGPRRLWTHLGLSGEMLRRPPDVLFVPAHVVPLRHPRATVVTIHDVGYRYFPAQHTWRSRAYLDWSTRYSCRAARHIIADSHATAGDLQSLYDVPASKISVVHLGLDPSLKPASMEEQMRVRVRYGLHSPYVLYLGTIQPRKNLARLVQAFARLPSTLAPLDLVLVGSTGWLAEGIQRAIREHGVQGRVRLTGYVPQQDLAPLLSAAVCFVLPSLYEGFGLPVLEAMACGTPVICSEAGSLREAAGDAALLFPPTDADALQAALLRVLDDESLRASLIERGHAQAQRFSWARCARETLDVLLAAGQP
ncbi:MAG: glycosyltransferase family 4 protein [Anaerolineae bacterium]